VSRACACVCVSVCSKRSDSTLVHSDLALSSDDDDDDDSNNNSKNNNDSDGEQQQHQCVQVRVQLPVHGKVRPVIVKVL